MWFSIEEQLRVNNYSFTKEQQTCTHSAFSKAQQDFQYYIRSINCFLIVINVIRLFWFLNAGHGLCFPRKLAEDCEVHSLVSEFAGSVTLEVVSDFDRKVFSI